MSKERFLKIQQSLFQNKQDKLKNNSDTSLFSQEFDKSRSESRNLSQHQIDQDKVIKEKTGILKTTQKEIDEIQHKLDVENQTKELMRNLLSDYSEYKQQVPFIGESVSLERSQENLGTALADLEAEMANFEQDL